jgi:pimeloyl-ACP methyl ester carboxylesterase
VVGHSLGGLVAIQTAATHGDSMAGAVIVDAPVRRPDPESEEGVRRQTHRTPGVYPDRDTALRHFRLLPPQPVEHRFLLDHVAGHSVRQTPQGWTWKFDPELFRHTLIPMRDQLRSVRCRVALLRGERSEVVPPDTAAYMYELLGRNAPVVAIPEARHHVTLDRPLAFVAALRTLLLAWEHSEPQTRRRL